MEERCINHGKRPFVTNIVWLLLVFVNSLKRILLFITDLPCRLITLCRDNRETEESVIFVQGALVTPPDRYPAKFFWNNISEKNIVSPKMCPLSSVEIRAMQLFNTTRLNKGLQSKLIAHSAGCNTALKLVEFLHNHYCAMVKHGLINNRNIDIGDLHSNESYEIIFRDENGLPLMVSPYIIRKLVLVSPPLGGVNLMKQYHSDSKDNLLLFFFRTIQKTVFREDNSIFRSLIPGPCKSNTDYSLSLCEKYGIDVLRVVTHYSEKFNDCNLIKPDCHPILLPYTIMGVHTSGVECQDNNRHDGLVSVESQTHGLNCSCKHHPYFTTDVYQCNDCKTLYANIDHFCISIGSTQREKRISNEVWLNVMEYVKS